MRGYFVSGTTDVEITTENLRADGEEEYLIPRRKESLTECDVDKSFAKHKFTLLICELWRAAEALHGGELKDTVFVRGLPLFPREKALEKNGFTLWDAANFYVWKELDCSCRRIAGFPWCGDEADGSDGGAIIERVGYDYTRTNSSVLQIFVVLHENDGYPPRRG